MKHILIIIIFLCLFFGFKCENFSKLDLLDSFNRRVYSFNRGLEYILINPISNYYINVLPKFMLDNIDNLFKNISDIQNLIFFSVTLNYKDAFNSFSRLTINSTFGIFGFFDLAKNLGFFYKQFDFYYYFNFKESDYMMLPFLGPGNIKWNIFLLISQIFNPFLYYFDKIFVYYFIELIHKRSQFEVDVDFFHKNMLDGFTFLRDIYIQNIFSKSIIFDVLIDEPPS